ncbi:MAG: hypothetical protein ACYTGD_19235 [Planctomycetota bacterium]|jgi:hypothetical protein
MVQVKCRRCGAAKELPDQHGPITVVCPVCRWRETYPARRPLPEKLAHDAGAAFKAHQQHEQLAASAPPTCPAPRVMPWSSVTATP